MKNVFPHFEVVNNNTLIGNDKMIDKRQDYLI